MCIDSMEINKTIIRYQFPLPRIYDLIDCLSEVKFFSKLDVKADINKFISEREMSGKLHLKQIMGCMNEFLRPLV